MSEFVFASVPWVLAVGSAMILWTLLWRAGTAVAGDTDLGRAMAAVYS